MVIWLKEPPQAFHFVERLMGGTDTPYLASTIVIQHMDKINQYDKDQEEAKVTQILKDSSKFCRMRKIEEK